MLIMCWNRLPIPAVNIVQHHSTKFLFLGSYSIGDIAAFPPTYRSIVNLRLSSSGQSNVIGITSGQTISINNKAKESTYLWWSVALVLSLSPWSLMQHRVKTISVNSWLVWSHDWSWKVNRFFNSRTEDFFFQINESLSAILGTDFSCVSEEKE